MATIHVSGRIHSADIVIDDSDVGFVLRHKWHVLLSGAKRRHVYVMRQATSSDVASGMPSQILLHRELVGAARGEIVDHIDGNTLDNRRFNLRIVHYAGNSRNSIHPLGRSGYRGVVAHRRGFQAQIHVNNKVVQLGTYRTAVEAAMARDIAARRLHGEHAVLNFG